MDIVDPHLHFFFLNQGDYHWLKQRNAPFWSDKARIAKPFGERDIALSGQFRLRGYVHIEAGFDNVRPWREVNALYAHCTKPHRIVAGIDLPGPDFFPQLNALKRNERVSGLRYILDEQASELLGKPYIRHRLMECGRANLAFDCQLNINDTIAVKHLSAMAQHSKELKLIINHAGWPSDCRNSYAIWRRNLRTLSENSSIAIKLSGWEMTNRDYSMRFAQNVINDALDIMGDSRVMLASNFPLCLLSCDYLTLWQRYLAVTPPRYVQRLFCDNACHWYGLDLTQPE